jgi:hypothetical protein
LGYEIIDFEGILDGTFFIVNLTPACCEWIKYLNLKIDIVAK